MDARIDLDAAAEQIEERREAWRRQGITVSNVTWREGGRGWSPFLETAELEAKEADSVGVSLSKGQQEGSVVLFRGGWADFLYWSGDPFDNPVDEAPGWGNWLTVETFGDVLDRLTGHFR